MKRTYANLLLLLLAGFIPFSMAFGQEKKTEQKIKVVVADKAGTKTVIDTTFTAGSIPDSIILDNGKVVYLGKSASGMTIVKAGEGKGNVYVTCTVSDDGEKSKEKKVVIMSGEKGEWTVTPSTGDKEHIYVYSNSDGKEGDIEKHIIVASAGDKDAIWEDAGGKKVIIVKDGKAITSGADGKTFTITVNSDDNDKDTDVTKYVIAKDGVVVTVESNDEAKAKEVLEALESKLDSKGDIKEKNEAAKPASKKAEKK